MNTNHYAYRCTLQSLTHHDTRHTPTVRRILSTLRHTQYDMLPQHQVNIRKLISECFSIQNAVCFIILTYLVLYYSHFIYRMC